MKTRMFALAVCVLALAACGSDNGDVDAFYRVETAPLRITVRGAGELQSTQPTPLMVPGRQWTSRQIAWLIDDGAVVRKGDIVARFSAVESEQDLAQARLDLERDLLKRAGKEAELAATLGQIGVDLSDVATQLGIARRYANAGFEALARNQVLDAVLDEKFLDTKQGILDWRLEQSAERGSAEMAVLDATRATMEINAEQKRADLEALELAAPNDGIFMLYLDWRGDKARVGSTAWAGTQLASIPDTASMEILIHVPQVEAQGLALGQRVRIHPIGLPEEAIETELTWIARSTQPRSSESPVKYLDMKAPVPATAVATHAWAPGQKFDVEIILVDKPVALSVPNLAITSAGDVTSVRIAGEKSARAITLGVRGADRSEVLEGLQPGDPVLLGGGAP